MKAWTTATVAAAAVLYVIALNNEVYNATSPVAWNWGGIVARKAYSVAAFGLLGYFFSRAVTEWRQPPGAWNTALAVGIYSAAVEIGQALHGSQEGLTWNLIDVACGVLGGWLGALVEARWPRPRPHG